MLRALLIKVWKLHPTKQQLYGHLPHILQAIQERQARLAGHRRAKLGRAHEQRSLLDSDSRTHQCWPTHKNLYSSALCKH